MKTMSNRSRDYFLRVLLHESIHIVSVDYLNTQFDIEDGITIAKNASIEAVTLLKLFNEAIDSKSATFGVELQQFRAEYNRRKNLRAEGKPLSEYKFPNNSKEKAYQQSIDKFYPFYNIKEFVAEMFTKESFRDEMNNVRSKVSFGEDFLKLIAKLLTKIGLKRLNKNTVAYNTFIVSSKLFTVDNQLKAKWFPEEKNTAFDKIENDAEIEAMINEARAEEEIIFEEPVATEYYINEGRAAESDSLEESNLDFIIAKGIEGGTFPMNKTTVQQVIDGDKKLTIRGIEWSKLNKPGIYPVEHNGETRYFYISSLAYDKVQTLASYIKTNPGLTKEKIIEDFNVSLEDIHNSGVKKFLSGDNKVQKNLMKVIDITKEFKNRKAQETLINCD
jgi:hypothetical protein